MNLRKFIDLLAIVDEEGDDNLIVMLAPSDLVTSYISTIEYDDGEDEKFTPRLYLNACETISIEKTKVYTADSLLGDINKCVNRHVNSDEEDVEVVMRFDSGSYNIMDIGLSKYGNFIGEFKEKRIVIHDLLHSYAYPNNCEGCEKYIEKSEPDDCVILDDVCLRHHNFKAIENFLRCNLSGDSLKIYEQEKAEENQTRKVDNNKLRFINNTIMPSKLKPLKKPVIGYRGHGDTENQNF